MKSDFDVDSKSLLYDKVRQRTKRRFGKHSEASENFAQYENEAFSTSEDLQMAGELGPSAIVARGPTLWSHLLHAEEAKLKLSVEEELNFFAKVWSPTVYVECGTERAVYRNAVHDKTVSGCEEDSFLRKMPSGRKSESRFMNQSELHWCDQDGNIRSTLRPPVFGHAFWTHPFRHAKGCVREPCILYAKPTNSIPYNYDLKKHCRIDIDISSVEFYHHPLFSEEHALASQLLTLYRDYCRTTTTLQEQIEHLKWHAGKIEEDRKESLIKLRQLVGEKQCQKKDLAERMLLLWNEIKQLRKKQGYSATGILLKYLRDHPEGAGEQFYKIIQEQKQDCMFHGANLVRSWNVEDNIFAELRRGSVSVTEDIDEATPVDQCPENERRRREDVSNTLLYMRIMCNGKEVCKTEHRALGQDFQVVWKQRYSLLVSQHPQTVVLQLHEKRGPDCHKVADVPLFAGDVEQSADVRRDCSTKLEFASDSTIAPRYSSVGCGWKSDQRWTTGFVCCSISGQILSNRAAVIRNRIGMSHNITSERSAVDGPLALQEGRFAAQEDMEENMRFHLLQLRARRVPEFRRFMGVPLLEKEYLVSLTMKIFSNKDRREMLQARNDQIEDLQAGRMELMRQMREKVLRDVQASHEQRAAEDIVIEESIPTMSTLGLSLVKLLRGHRSLRPRRRERKRIGMGQDIGEVKILVTVLRATNVPVRREAIHSSSEVVTGVSPFVEVMFQRETVQTFVADGPHPTWNQELHLPLSYDCASLDQGTPCLDIIFLNLFDQVVLDVLEDDRERSTTVHQRLQQCWLGSLKVPFMTLYLNGKMEGTFQLDVPPVLLGYKHTESRPVTCLSLFMTVEPSLQPPESIGTRWESEEPPELLERAHKFEEALRTKYPSRLIKVLATDIHGKWVFVPRYLHPIPPPSQFLLEGPNMDVAARFVSLIPTVADSALFSGACDIWSTCDQFLNVVIGDEEEHAILLCNFFLSMGKSAFLLLGWGIPEGQTAYVLTLEEELWLWNAVTGKRYSVRDTCCPLQSIGCIIGRDNVWANVQKHDLPSRMSFNLKKASLWRPLLKKRMAFELHTVQPDHLQYTATDVHFAEQLEHRIVYVLKENMMNWRKRFRTSWNRHASRILQDILPRLESVIVSNAKIDSDSLSELSSSYKVSGFPLNMAFTTVDAVVETVLSTGVHLTEEKSAEFALAVKVHPYPCKIFAVWVYIAVLTPRI